MTFQRPTLLQLIQRATNALNSHLTGTDAALRRANTNALAKMHSGGVHGLYGYLAYIAEQVIYDTADSEYLERWASIWKVFRKPADYATGNITVTGQSGAVVPSGTEYQRADGIAYTLDAEITLVTGTATGIVTAVAAGIDGNADEGATLNMAIPIAGVTSAAAVAGGGIAGGVDAEDDDGLRSRFIERLRRTPQAGADYDYEGWVLEVPGVTRAWCVGKQFGGGTVGLTFVCDGQAGSIIPAAPTVAEVAAYIETKRPVTDDVTVYAPVADPLNPIIQLTPGTTEVKAAVEAELLDYLSREAAPGGTTLVSKLNEAISIAAGEADHALVSPAANIVHAVGHIAVLGTITWA